MLSNLRSFFLDVVEVIVFAVAIFLFVYLVLFQPHKIKGSSMEPNFPNGEYLLTDKISYRFSEPERGDVIVFEAPNANGDEFIKRIIGLPGETVKIENNNIFINGEQLQEKYIPEEIPTTVMSSNVLSEGEEITIPDNHYFVLGDNRPASSDSRIWGLIDNEDITGRAWIVYWPPGSSGLIPDVEYSL